VTAIDLVILGQLMNASKSAYEMKKDLESQNIKDWVKIGTSTIFQNLVKLYKKGFLDAKKVKESEMPEKTVYSINEKGREQFHILMRKFSAELRGIYFDFSAVVVNLDKIDRNEALEMAGCLGEQFLLKRSQAQELIETKSPLPVHALCLIQLYEGLYNYLCDWSEKLRKAYTK
jgi:DNA-binding PadR family transcriptional regulator